jgi:hypothetical protein
MLGMDFATLAAQAGDELITTAVTDGWEDVRLEVARLFGRGEIDRKIEQKLDATRRQLDAARSTGDLERVQADLARDWAVRLKDLLADYPDAEAGLTALVKQIKPTIGAAADHSVSGGRDVKISADRGSVSGGVIDGDVTITDPFGRGSANG